MSTAALDSPNRVEPAKPGGRFSPRVVTAITVTAIVAAALLLRLIGLTTAYDVFVDEPFYVMLGQSVAAGHLVPIGYGQDFLLHPPGFFIVEAVWSKIIPLSADSFHNVYMMRVLQQLLAAGSAMLIFFLVRQLAGYRPALVGAILFSVDPYFLQQNARVLLETSAMTLILGGYLLLVRLAQAEAAHRLRTALLCGTLFGGAILTKDMSLIVTLLPLVAIAIANWFGLRREAVLAAAAAVGIYLLYVLSLLVSGHGSEFWSAKTSGLSRAFGTNVTTGFSAKNSPSLFEAIWTQLTTFSGSYTMIALGAAAGLWLLVRPQLPQDRILGLFTGTATLMLAYDLVAGTVEEQFLYFLAVPALLSLTVMGARLTHRSKQPHQLRRVFAAGLTAILVLNLFVWARIHSSADDGQREAFQWLQEHAPADSKIAWVASQTDMSMHGSTFVTLPLGLPSEMAANNVTYLVVLEKTVRDGYSFVQQDSVDWYAAHSTKVFSFVGRTYGEVAIYQTTDSSVW